MSERCEFSKFSVSHKISRISCNYICATLTFVPTTVQRTSLDQTTSELSKRVSRDLGHTRLESTVANQSGAAIMNPSWSHASRKIHGRAYCACAYSMASQPLWRQDELSALQSFIDEQQQWLDSVLDTLGWNQERLTQIGKVLCVLRVRASSM